MIRILVVHQTRLIASLIASVLTEEEGIYVVGLATSVEEALGKVERSNCNMMLVAATLPNQGALTLTRDMNELDPTVKVMVIGMPDSENMILQYVMAGASGYVLQDVTTERLLENIWAAHNEKALISPDIAATLINQLADLAHAVKNPLTVIRNEARNLAGREGRLILEQSYEMANSIDHSLSRARIFGRQDALGYRTSVRAVIEDLRYALEHLYKDRDVSIRLVCEEDRWFRGADFKPREFEEDESKILTLYRSRGYLDIEVKDNKHLNEIMAALRAEGAVSSVDRIAH